MAKESREGKSKLRVLFGFAEVEGSDASIQDALRNFSAAVTRATQQLPPPRVIKALPQGQKPGGNGAAQQPGLFDDADQPNGQEVEAGEEQVLDGEFAPAEEVREKKPKQPAKAPSYTRIGSLNLRPDGKPSLKDFFAQKNPGDNQEQTAVFIYYLIRTLGLSGIGANHLFSCFKEVEKRVPTDIMKVVRNTATRKAWVDPSDPDNLKITTAGENFVEHDLPKKDSK